MKRLFYCLFLVLALQACGGGEESAQTDLQGDYSLVTLQVGDIALPNATVSLSLKADSNYTSEGFDINVDPEIKASGKWSFNDEKKQLKLDGMNFDINRFESDTLEIACNSHSIDFTIVLKR